MQTTLQYQQRVNNQKSVRYVLPGSLHEVYKQHDPAMAQVLRNTQTCPFTSIRQLILAFGRTDPYSSDVNLSDILKEKYRVNPQLLKVDEQLNACIKQIQLSHSRFSQLSKCVQHYNGLYSSITKKQQNSQRQAQGNESKAQFNERLLRKQNQIALDKQNKYFQYVSYSQQLERALVLASLSQSEKLNPQNVQNNPMSNLNNFRILNDVSHRMQKQFQQNLQRIELELFEWRQKSKHGFITNQDYNQSSAVMDQWRQKSKEMDKIYTQLGNFTKWIQQDREQLRRIYQSNQQNYQSFLPSYIKAKQILQVSSHNSTYFNLIREEKKKLQTHLRNNYGMVVPYGVSDEYAKMVLPMQNPKNRQLKQMVAEELIPLEDGLNYINNQYEKLYKNACDGSSGVKSQVEGYIKKFTNYSQMANQNNNFAIHLIESNRKLLRIVQ